MFRSACSVCASTSGATVPVRGSRPECVGVRTDAVPHRDDRATWRRRRHPCPRRRTGVLDRADARDGRIGTCGADGLTRLWDQSGKKLQEFPSQGDWVYRVAFTPDAAELAAGTFTGAVAMFETATGKLVATLRTSR